MRKCVASEYTPLPKPLQILSAFQRDSLPGMVYVEARYPEQVRQACEGLIDVHLTRGIHLVPIDEMPSLLTVKKPDLPVSPGSWVRILRGNYLQDLAQVVSTTENGDTLTIRCVPRIDLTPRDDVGAVAGVGRLKRKKCTVDVRPRQRLFHYAEVVKRYGRNAVSRQDQLYIFRTETYKEGYLLKSFNLSSLMLENVNPTLDEIAMFSHSDAELEDEVMDFSSIVDSSRRAANALLEPGDRVEVCRGELIGVQGVVEEISGDILTLTAVGANLSSQKLLARWVQKVFKVGDHVKVIAGKNAGETGLVVSVTDNVVTFLDDMSLHEVSVFPKDLKQAYQIESGVKPIGKYRLHDLVQLR